MKYKAIIFDLYGTLIDDLSFDEYRQVLAQMAEVLSVSYHDFTKQWDTASYLRTTGFFKTMEDSIRQPYKELGVAVDKEPVRAAAQIRMDYMRNALMPREDALDTLDIIPI